MQGNREQLENGCVLSAGEQDFWSLMETAGTE